MRRTFLSFALVASLVAVPVALGHDGPRPENDHGKPEKVAKIAKVKMAMFEFSGKVAEIGDGTITISPVRAHGKASRVALGDAVSFTVKLDAATRITRGEMGRVTLDKAMVGDRVKVEIRAPRGTALVDLPAAKRVKLKAAKVVEPATEPGDETAPVVTEPVPVATPTA
jgi:hypothetical protein